MHVKLHWCPPMSAHLLDLNMRVEFFALEEQMRNEKRAAHNRARPDANIKRK